jgi:hypothetical protein
MIWQTLKNLLLVKLFESANVPRVPVGIDVLPLFEVEA